MNPVSRRRALLAVAFVSALVSAALAPSEESAPSPKPAGKAPAPASPGGGQKLAARVVEIPPLLNYRRTLGEGVEVVDLFEPKAPPSVAAPPAKPVPPKPPFVYMGLIEEGGRTKAVLAQGEQLHIVTQGETFAGSYRLETVSSEEVVLLYVPLDARQSLSMGGGAQ
jgi:hypothetical protein